MTKVLVRAWDLAGFQAAEGTERQARAEDLDRICRDTGFLVLSGHGVPDAIIQGVWEAAAAFFALPPEEKARVSAPHPGYPYGWLGPDREALARSRGEDTPPDLKESFNGGPLTIPEGIGDPDAYAFCYAPTLWPDLPGFRPAWEAYYRAVEDLAARVMRAMAAAVGLPEDHFDAYLRAPVSALRALHYPATPAAALPGQQPGRIPTTARSRSSCRSPARGGWRSGTPTRSSGPRSLPRPTPSSSTWATSWPAGRPTAGCPRFTA